jgi:hypothetical protein
MLGFADLQHCDNILGTMESMLGQFQADLGNISGEIQSLQEQVCIQSTIVQVDDFRGFCGLLQFVPDSWIACVIETNLMATFRSTHTSPHFTLLVGCSNCLQRV